MELSETWYRGKLSSFQPRRNCPWKHGTMKAASIVFSSNSDFQSSDRLPNHRGDTRAGLYERLYDDGESMENKGAAVYGIGDFLNR